MFELYTITDHFLLKPSQIGNEQEALKAAVVDRFLHRFISKVGLCLSIDSIERYSDKETAILDNEVLPHCDGSVRKTV